MRRILAATVIGLASGTATAQFTTVVAASSNAANTVPAPGGGNYTITNNSTGFGSTTFSIDGAILNATGQVGKDFRKHGQLGTISLRCRRDVARPACDPPRYRAR
jgi:hypothetical protein